MRVYHFLPTEYALANIALQRMRISRLAELNDPFELLAINVGYKKNLRKKIAQLKSDFHESKGLICFSKGWHNPVLWSHYAAKHHGVCLGFEIPDDQVRIVQYSTDRIAARITDSGGFDADDPLVDELLYTKYSHWEYEDEVRMVVPLDKSTVEDGSYFYSFSSEFRLVHIILGALCQVPIWRVRDLVAHFENAVFVDKARLSYKFFKVVQDEKSKATASTS